MKTSLLAALTLALPLIVHAQGVWRCGPDGRSFSDTPCAGGRPLDVTMAARPAEDVQAARAQAERNSRLADALRRERLAQEALQRGNGLAALGPQNAERLRPAKPDRAPSKELAKHRRQLHAAAPGTWPAAAPVSRRTKD
jgi:hypothetical protein